MINEIVNNVNSCLAPGSIIQLTSNHRTAPYVAGVDELKYQDMLSVLAGQMCLVIGELPRTHGRYIIDTLCLTSDGIFVPLSINQYNCNLIAR